MLLNGIPVYFNFLSLGFLLVTALAFFFFFFLSGIKEKSSYTKALAATFFFQGCFYSGYFLASSIYHPVAANHRLITVGFIFPSLLYFLQFFLLYPENNWHRFQKFIKILQWVTGLLLLAIFFVLTRNAEYKFHFTGHYWDFDAEYISKIIAYSVMVYILIIPVAGSIRIIAFWKERKHRNALLLFTVSFMVGTILPSILNTLSRDGTVPRDVFLNVFVISVAMMIFSLSIIYINVTEDRTTFMAKITGITLITFLFLMQGISYFTLQDKEKEYDTLSKAYLEKAIYGQKYDEKLMYIYQYDLKTKALTLIYEGDRYRDASGGNRIDFVRYLPDLENTALYERIKHYNGDDLTGFLKQEISFMPEHFRAYGEAILTKALAAESKSVRKEVVLNAIDRINRLVFVQYNRISFLKNKNFLDELRNYLKKKMPEELSPFSKYIHAILEKETIQDGKYLKEKIYAYMAPLKGTENRFYRISNDGLTHYISYLYYDKERNIIYEGGYRYEDYRLFLHETSLQHTLLFVVIFFVITVIYPFFFKGSLIRPLEELVRGVKLVNRGDLNVKVPVHVHDEIGFLAMTFNNMVVSIKEAREKLQEYASNLEEKVRERTAELHATLDEIHRLKQIQDGDYYLASLLLQPLMLNLNKSKSVRTEYFIKQYKEFSFKGKVSEIGGDICITGNLRFGKSLEEVKRYVLVMNGDAMGKSTQGASGALVMGVVMNSIIARSARNDRVLDTSPENWLREVYEEIQSIFLTFDGSMNVSCILGLIEEDTGRIYYFNAEHPFPVLLRNGKASFVGKEIRLRKIGLINTHPFEVQTFQLEPGDIFLLGSDGKDDIEIEKKENGIRIINEDENLFLKIVEETEGDLERIYKTIQQYGRLTDDFSLLKIIYESETRKEPPDSEVIREESIYEDFVVPLSTDRDDKFDYPVIVIDAEDEEEIQFQNDFLTLFEKGMAYWRTKEFRKALEYFEEAYGRYGDDRKVKKYLVFTLFHLKEFTKAKEILLGFLQHEPENEDYWLYLSIAYRKTKELDKALHAAEKAYSLNQKKKEICLQLAILNYLVKNLEKAKAFLDMVFDLEPGYSRAKKLQDKLETILSSSNQTG